MTLLHWSWHYATSLILILVYVDLGFGSKFGVKGSLWLVSWSFALPNTYLCMCMHYCWKVVEWWSYANWAKFFLSLIHFCHLTGICYHREAMKLTEVTVSDKLESFRASKEVIPTIYSLENFFYYRKQSKNIIFRHKMILIAADNLLFLLVIILVSVCIHHGFQNWTGQFPGC